MADTDILKQGITSLVIGAIAIFLLTAFQTSAAAAQAGQQITEQQINNALVTANGQAIPANVKILDNTKEQVTGSSSDPSTFDILGGFLPMINVLGRVIGLAMMSPFAPLVLAAQFSGLYAINLVVGSIVGMLLYLWQLFNVYLFYKFISNKRGTTYA